MEVMIAQASWEVCSVDLRALFACLDEKGARQCSTAEELLERAREKGLELTALDCTVNAPNGHNPKT
jgi:hypothetical protein